MEHAFAVDMNTKPLPRGKRLRLTETQVLTIFSLRPENADNKIVCSSSELAAYYKVTHETIKSIWSGKTWGVETGKTYLPHQPKLKEKKATETSLSDAIDNQLYNWAHKRFIHKRLFTNDAIPNLEN